MMTAVNRDNKRTVCMFILFSIAIVLSTANIHNRQFVPVHESMYNSLRVYNEIETNQPTASRQPMQTLTHRSGDDSLAINAMFSFRLPVAMLLSSFLHHSLNHILI